VTTFQEWKMPPTRSSNCDGDNSTNRESTESALSTRNGLAYFLAVLVAVISLVAAFQKDAMSVLDKILPLLTLAFGFYFGQQRSRL
jgi:hypothetical protein